MKRLLYLLFLFPLLAFGADAKLAPKVFGGWQLESSTDTTDAAQMDPLYSDLLKEYGFAQLETAQYAKEDRTLTAKIARFNDASGAFGAYTFYRAPNMAAEEIGDRAASNNERILFLRGNLLVDVKIDKVTPMTGGELRELASLLPAATGNNAILPPLLANVPQQAMVEHSLKYVIGPVGLGRIDSPITAQEIGFDTNPEIATARYKTGEGEAKLMLVKYPTNPIAGDRLRTIEQLHSGTNNPSKVWAKRTGPVVAVVSGSISGSEAKTLLANVNYEADVTWNQDTGANRKNNIGNLLYNVILLIGIMLVFAVGIGIAFFGMRVAARKFLPNRIVDRPEDVEIIRLNIGD